MTRKAQTLYGFKIEDDVVTKKISKNLFISLISGAISFALFILIYGNCSWGGCSSGSASIGLFIVAITSITSIIFFLLWIRDILKLTFSNREYEQSEKTVNQRNVLLSILSFGIFSNAMYNLYYLERISEIVKAEVLYFKGIKTFFIIIGAIGVWLHRRWGALVTITVFLVIVLPIIWNNIIYTHITNPYLIVGYIFSIVILAIKFKDMK